MSMKQYIESLEIGKLLKMGNMGIIPIIGTIKVDETLDYLDLTQAIQEGTILISEVNKQGSVPNLKVINKGDIPVLLLDGEELEGAKQNRILNTTLLIEEKSEKIIPVSCTEQGRWSYVSSNFKDSGNIASSRIRRRKSVDVTNSLRKSGKYYSNQPQIWEHIQEISKESHISSPTGALKDIYSKSEDELKKYLDKLTCQNQQKGSIFFINGKIVGMDVLSTTTAYKNLHQKILSYSLEAILNEAKKEEKYSKQNLKDFLNSLEYSIEEKHPSVGLGWDYRFESADTIGSSLIYNDEVLHAAFFPKEPSEDQHMSSYRQRRKFRANRL